MNADPYPGLRAVGGAGPYPWAALAQEVVDSTWRLTRDLTAAYPSQAALAALSWHANQAITRQVTLTYAVADLARQHAEAFVDAGEHGLPEGPLRQAVIAAAKLQMEYALAAEEAATQFGRRFGHLAFAFPRPG